MVSTEEKLDTRMLMLGLQSSGKTRLLYKLKLDEEMSTIPTYGFNVETIEIEENKITIWDIGGQEKIIPFWRSYVENSKAIIWIIDSNDDIDNMNLSKETLIKFVSESQITAFPIIIVLSKLDLSPKKTPSEICSLFDSDLKSNGINRVNYFTSNNVKEGLKWILYLLN